MKWQRVHNAEWLRPPQKKITHWHQRRLKLYILFFLHCQKCQLQCRQHTQTEGLTHPRWRRNTHTTPTSPPNAPRKHIKLTHCIEMKNWLDVSGSFLFNSSPRSAYFVCYSYRFRCLFYWNVSALRSGHHRIFLHDSSSKRTYIFHSKCIEVCKTWIKIVYIYRGIWCHTRPCVKTLRSANPWMNVPEIK